MARLVQGMVCHQSRGLEAPVSMSSISRDDLCLFSWFLFAACREAVTSDTTRELMHSPAHPPYMNKTQKRVDQTQGGCLKGYIDAEQTKPLFAPVRSFCVELNMSYEILCFTVFLLTNPPQPKVRR